MWLLMIYSSWRLTSNDPERKYPTFRCHVVDSNTSAGHEDEDSQNPQKNAQLLCLLAFWRATRAWLLPVSELESDDSSWPKYPDTEKPPRVVGTMNRQGAENSKGATLHDKSTFVKKRVSTMHTCRIEINRAKDICEGPKEEPVYLRPHISVASPVKTAPGLKRHP